MWIPCPGSMAMPENQQDSTYTTFADDGTVSHHWSASALSDNTNADDYLGQTYKLHGEVYEMDETRASFCQMYIDDVRHRAIGGMLFVEQSLDISDILGEDQGGTADAVIYQPSTKCLTVEDLKYGTGEKVYAQYDGKINPQLGLYLLGAIKDIELMGYPVETVRGVICQPRLGHIDEHIMSIEDLNRFGGIAKMAVKAAGVAITQPPEGLLGYLNPGEKQCRWCRAKAVCPALSKHVADQVRCDFETIQAEPPTAPRGTDKLGQAYMAVPLIEDWCRAVRAELNALVSAGTKVIGPDGLPYRLVEGREGSRAWSDPTQAESALLGQLGPDKAYAPQKIITAPQAAKLLDKKATKAIWADVFEPLIKKPPGKPVLACGSDPRPPFTGAADANDFDELQSE
jgi:hypothetical protein